MRIILLFKVVRKAIVRQGRLFGGPPNRLMAEHAALGGMVASPRSRYSLSCTGSSPAPSSCVR